MPKYLGVTYITEAEFNSPTAAMLASAEVFAVGGDSTVLYVSNGRSLVASSGDPAPTIDGAMALGQTLRARMAPGWTATGYVWRRDGTPISGATSVTYVAQAADVAPGVALTVEATGLSRVSRARVAAAATRPDTPLAPVLTALANAISVAYTAPASSTAILESQFLATTGAATTLTSSPQTITFAAGTPVAGSVRFRNVQGWSDYSPQSNTVTPTGGVVPVAPTVASAAAISGTPTVGTPLSITAATFNGTPAPTVSRVIRMDGTQVASGTQSTTYTPVSGDVGKIPSVTDTATNSAGTVGSTGAGSAVVSGAALKSFNTTDSFSQGDQVLYAGGVYSMTAAHAPGNWTGNDATYVGQNSDAPLNTVGFSKPMGVVQSWTAGVLATGNTSAPTQSRGLKMDAEALFTKVRVAMFQREPTPQRGYAMSVASTETDAVGSLSNAISPIVNGTAHNVLKGADPFGFAKLTWAGAARSPVQPGCGVTVPGQGYTTNMSSVFSDWADCASVPVVTGKRPMLVARLSRIVNFGDANSNVSTNGTTGAYNRYVANDPTGRMLINMLAGTNGDHAADPTLALNGSTYDPTTVSSWQNLAFMFEHLIATRNFGGFGDSITEGYGIWQTPVLQISTQKAPCYTANFGCSTNRSAQYIALLESQLRGDNYLTDIIMPSFSPNEPTTITTAMADGFISELARMVALCAAYKKRLYIWTSYAALTTRYAGTSSVTEINRINDWVRTEAAKTGATFQLIEIANGYDNASMTIGGADNTHPNATGVAYFNSRILPAIQKGI